MDIVIHEGSQVAGSARIIFIDDTTAKIKNFTVLPEYRGKNVGRALMGKIEDYLKEKSVKKSIIDSPKFIKGFQVGWLWKETDSFYIYQFDQYSAWLGDAPQELLTEINSPQNFS